MRRRIACLHDLASYGGAALMNIIPIMYSKGIEVSPVPTSLFTSHGAVEGVKSYDTSAFMKEYTMQYLKLNLSFDGIYLGLFTTLFQMEEALKFLESFSKENTLVLLDPIMGDNGKLYGFIHENNVNAMRNLAKRADIITPNLTEACILSGIEYKDVFSEVELERLLDTLSSLGPKHIVVTSVSEGKLICTYVYSKGKIQIIKRERLSGSYPGTGDAFSAYLMAEMLKGTEIIEAVEKAMIFIEEGIKIILKNGYKNFEGLPIAEYLYDKQ